jgi:hypothetical protein
MTVDTTLEQRPSSDDGGKGLKSGALGLVSSVVIGVASTVPAYSLAATLGFARDFVMRGLIPTLGGLMLFSGLIITAFQDWKPENSYVSGPRRGTGRSAGPSCSGWARSRSGSC